MKGATSGQLYARLLSYVRPYAKVFALGVLGMVAAAATEPLFPALIKPLLDKGFGPKGPSIPPIVFAGAIVAIFLVRGVLTFTSSYLMNWVSSRVVLDLRAAMFDRLLRLPTKFYDDNTSGALLSKVAYDVSNVSGAATFVLTVLVRDSIAVIVYIAMQDTVGTRATVGEFASFMTAMLMLLAPIKHLTELNPHIQRGLAGAESVFGLIDTPAEEDRGTIALGRARGEVAFDNASFTYPT